MTCAGINSKGKPCKRSPSSHGAFCVWHGPDGTKARNAEQRIFDELSELESTPAQAHEIDWLYLRLQPNPAQMEWLMDCVCEGPAWGPEDLTREQAAELISLMRYLAARDRAER
jgi:hypothetical protein